MALVDVLLVALWVVLPAYVPNNAAVLVGGGPPIDGGRALGGNRLLGDGKTWLGTAGGTAAGAVLATGQNVVRPVVADLLPTATTLPEFPLAVVVALPLGAMVGDVVASFGKRRLDRERGAPLPVVDQLDFVVGALVLAAVAAPGWFTTTFTIPVLVTILVATPILHVGTNVAAYQLSLKSEPW
jgi:CDP-2,3-bis-(O-geranylgeranyl)-sn-glycerol synthase